MTVEEAVQHAKARGYEAVAICAYNPNSDTVMVIDLGASERSQEAFYKLCKVEKWTDIRQ